MAGDGEEETEYESDPEEVKMSLKMRRREASDDEEEDDEGEEEEEKGEGDGEERRELASARASDVESDGQGGAAEYDDEELEEEEYYDEYEEEEEEEELVAAGDYVENGAQTGGGHGEGDATQATGRDEVVGELNEGEAHEGEEQIGEGEKKENEPFMVPTAGAFYMHDDRFRENMVGRNRRTLGGRKLWESKDEKKWGHDKFEEMNTRDRPYDEGRKSSRGRSRGRGRGRGGDRGYVRGGARTRSYSEENNNNNVSNVAPKTVRGRGPRRYQALTKVKSEGPLPPNKQSQKVLDKASHCSSRRADTSASHMDSGPLLAKRVASNLNSASPPFYPSGTSKKDSAVNQKRDDQSANGNRNIPPIIHENSSVQQSNSLMRGKNVVGSVGMEKLYIDSPQSKGPNSFRSSPSQNQISRNSSAAQTNSGQRNHAQGRGQSSSPPNSGLSITVLESGDADLAESSKSKPDLAGKGKGTTHGSGRGSFLYSGIPVVGSGGPGDQNFPGTPAFLPVMQYGAPGVGMAFPGYVAQPQLGMGNSEMTWLPFLTGAGGAMGASYLPPYVAVDGTYHARPAGQTPALPASSKENNVNKPNNEGKSQQKSDPVNDEYSQRQKPRRYSEMNFGQ